MKCKSQAHVEGDKSNETKVYWGLFEPSVAQK